MELIVGRRAGPHTGPADRKTPLRVGTPQQDADAASCCSATSSEVRSLVSMTCEAEPAWRDCTCGSGSESPTKCERQVSA